MPLDKTNLPIAENTVGTLNPTPDPVVTDIVDEILYNDVSGARIATEIDRWNESRTNRDELQPNKPMPIGANWVWNPDNSNWERPVLAPENKAPDWWDSINKVPQDPNKPQIQDPMAFVKKYGIWIAIAALAAILIFKK